MTDTPPPDAKRPEALAGTPLCAVCKTRPAEGLDKYTDVATDKRGRRRHIQRRVAKCRGRGCHVGTFVTFPWVTWPPEEPRLP